MAADLYPRRPEASPLFPAGRSGKVKPCPRCQRRNRLALVAVAAVLSLIAGIVAAFCVRPAAAYGGTSRATLDSYAYAGNRILDEAETKVDHLYAWGAAGPAYFDCSGLVYWAAVSTGERNWPRDTYGIARQIGTRFSLTSHPQRGDLAMWGSVRAPYHVEFVTLWYQVTFGAETYGWAGRVTWHYDGWFRPSFYLHINW